MRRAWHMNVVQREKEEESIFFVFLNKVDCLSCNHTGDIFIDPTRGFATTHVADTTDAVDDGVVVSVARMEFQFLGIFSSGWLVANLPREINPQRVFRIQSNDTMILNINTRHPIAGCRENKGII